MGEKKETEDAKPDTNLQISGRYALVLSSPERLYDLGDLLGHVSRAAFRAVLVEVVAVVVAVEIIGQVDRVAQALDDAVHVARVAEVL